MHLCLSVLSPEGTKERPWGWGWRWRPEAEQAPSTGGHKHSLFLGPPPALTNQILSTQIL